MKRALISDIHANLEALETVLSAVEGAYDSVICCGDLVGYGADPNAVTEWVRGHAQAVVRGNHDRASVGMEDLEWFNPVARTAAEWTMRELSAENAEYVRGLPKGPVMVDHFTVAHGSPLDEDEYMVGELDASQSFAYTQSSLVFFGHTHIQGGFALRYEDIDRIAPPAAKQGEVRLELAEGCSYLVNPGSIGQPRDGDPRAAFALYLPEEHCVIYRRVSYPVAAAQRKIRRAGLPGVLADRLEWGR